MKKEIVTIITAVTGERVIVGKNELAHAMLHFSLPQDIFLELLERILKEPDKVFIEEKNGEKEYKYF